MQLVILIFYRSVLWDELHKFKLHAHPVDGLKHTTPAFLPLEQTINQSSLLPYPNIPSIVHTSAKHPKGSLICVNSVIETQLDLENNKKFFVMSSFVKTTQPDRLLRLSGKAYLINTILDMDEVKYS